MLDRARLRIAVEEDVLRLDVSAMHESSLGSPGSRRSSSSRPLFTMMYKFALGVDQDVQVPAGVGHGLQAAVAWTRVLCSPVEDVVVVQIFHCEKDLDEDRPADLLFHVESEAVQGFHDVPLRNGGAPRD